MAQHLNQRAIVSLLKGGNELRGGPPTPLTRMQLEGISVEVLTPPNVTSQQMGYQWRVWLLAASLALALLAGITAGLKYLRIPPVPAIQIS